MHRDGSGAGDRESLLRATSAGYGWSGLPVDSTVSVVARADGSERRVYRELEP